MDFGVISTNKKEAVKKVDSPAVKADKVTKPAKQKVVKVVDVAPKKLGRKRRVPEDWLKLGVKIAPTTNDDLKIALVHHRATHPSQDSFVNAAIEHYIEHLNKKKK